MNRLTAGRVLGVLSQLAGIGLLLVSAWLIVRAAEQPPVLYLMVAIVAVRFFGLSRAVLRYAERLLVHDAAFTLMTKARIEAYRALERLAPRGLAGGRRGDLVNRVVADVDAVQDRMLRLRTPWIVALCSSVVVITIVTWIDPRCGLAVGACAGMAMALIRVVVPRSGDRAHVAAWRGELAAEVSQAVLGAPDLLVHGAAAPVAGRLRDRSADLARAQRQGAWMGGLGSAIVLVSTGVSIALAAVLSSGLEPVLVGVVVLAPLALAEPLEGLADAERLRPEIDAALARLGELTDVPDPVAGHGSRELPAHNDLVAEDLGVGWDHDVVSGISFSLDEGDVIAVAGPSGAGKSTLALTLAGLLEPRGGRILLGGVDVKQLSAADVRTRVGYLGQDEVVFDTTIRENLRIADPWASDETMRHALRRAGIDAFVDTLPMGLATAVGEGGNRLSGGERQRLCLARLLLGGHRVLILDEPTEHLDEDAADALMTDVLNLRGTHSLIVVSHAGRVLSRFDHVVSLDARVPRLADVAPASA